MSSSERNAAKLFTAQEMLRRLLRLHPDQWTSFDGLFSGSDTDMAWQKLFVEHLLTYGILEQGRRKDTPVVSKYVYRLQHGGLRIKLVGELMENDDLLRQVIDFKPLRSESVKPKVEPSDSEWASIEFNVPPDVYEPLRATAAERFPSRDARVSIRRYILSLIEADAARTN